MFDLFFGIIYFLSIKLAEVWSKHTIFTLWCHCKQVINWSNTTGSADVNSSFVRWNMNKRLCDRFLINTICDSFRFILHSWNSIIIYLFALPIEISILYRFAINSCTYTILIITCWWKQTGLLVIWLWYVTINSR